jgi:hypothetical protein
MKYGSIYITYTNIHDKDISEYEASKLVGPGRRERDNHEE